MNHMEFMNQTKNMNFVGLAEIRNSILITFPKNSFYRKCKAISKGNNEYLADLLMEHFMARDSGDEPDEDLLFVADREIDIEKDYEFTYDYTHCYTTRDFKMATEKVLEKHSKCELSKLDYKANVLKKFRKLTKQKNIPMPNLHNLVNYILNPDCYQDKLKFFKELIDAYHEELAKMLNEEKDVDDNFELPF